MFDVRYTDRWIDGVGSVSFATAQGADDDVSRRICDDFVVEPNFRYVLNTLAGQNEFIDVGANIGYFALPLAMKGCRTLAVEALPLNYTLLTLAVAKNKLTNLIPVHAAALELPGTANVIGYGPWGAVSSREQGTQVPAVPLDELIRLHSFTKVSLIKIDVEGSEIGVLRGLKETIARHRELTIIIEVNGVELRRAGNTVRQVLETLEKDHFKLFGFFGNQLVERTSFDFQEVYSLDYLAIRGKNIQPPEGFFLAPLTAQQSVAYLKQQLELAGGIGVRVREYLAHELKGAPAWIRDTTEIREALKSLTNDEVLAVRKAAAWARHETVVRAQINGFENMQPRAARGGEKIRQIRRF